MSGLEDSTQVMGSAYIDETTKKIITVFVNESQSPRPVSLTVQGTTVSSYTPYVTSDAATDNLKQGTAVSYSGNQYTIPPRSVVTLVASYT